MGKMSISWESFKVHNQDSRGIRYKFEDLCRQLFANENLSANVQFRYLHANPNNAGLETEPIYDELNNRWIGFQAKYFESDVDYSQIKASANMIVKYYTKGHRVDLVYLFCNKPITSTANGYVETVKILGKSNIELQLITDTTILDLVRNKYPYLALYYFDNHTIGREWFINQAEKMYDQLGDRFNQKINVETEVSHELSLFLRDNYAVDAINAKKKDLVQEIDKKYTRDKIIKIYLKTLKDTVIALPDINIETMNDSVKWYDTVVCKVKPYMDMLTEERKKLEEKKKELYFFDFDDNKNEKTHEVDKREYQEVISQIYHLNDLIELPNRVLFSEKEKKLLNCDIMLMAGRAGTGKSHLLAYNTRALLSENRTALLLLAGIYYTDLPICNQIMTNLGLGYEFEDLIDILETIGERENRIIPVFIDALNETWNRKLWKNDLQEIIGIIEKRHMVKMVLSYRPEYEQDLFSDFVLKKKDNGEIVHLVHAGFEENSTSAVREFLNYYNIPFTPMEYFGMETSNPLFLTLYCKTYNGEEVSLPVLYERMIKKVSDNIYGSLKLYEKGFSERDDIIGPFIDQICENMVLNNRRYILKTDLKQISYWTEYGIPVAPFINHLVKEGLLHNYIYKNSEYYYFAFDQMNDYYFARSILTLYPDKRDVRNILVNNILKIKDGKLNSIGDIDIFVNACALYAEKYGEECIDIIDSLKEPHEQKEVFSRYINSMQWRDTKCINEELFFDLLKKYPCNTDALLSMLIGNGLKTGHPLNANFLHKFLSRFELNKRDCLWTVYINDFTRHNENRVVQLIKMYDCGEKLENANEKQIELLLILFGWLLASSNRWLRDYSSKAMIEIMKEHFQFCIVILEKFKEVNDPYILQRLYGVVFGACCKREQGNLQPLAEYVYESVFNKEKVYPDILLRDYARLIVEKFLSETPDYNGVMVRERISPPYNSEPIPDIEDQHYEAKDYDGAIFRMVMSMSIDNMGGYGDFGRYIFQSVLHNFDVDDKKMFNYAVYYILNELGFNEKYFGKHDRYCGEYDRHTTVKTERIGKKYQWITMYNMLARISDYYKMVDIWNYPEKKEVLYEGPWNLHVRDFDPTLNASFMICKEAPVFKVLEDHVIKGKEENRELDILTDESKKLWLETESIFFKDLKGTLILTDDDKQQWICLTKYCETGLRDHGIDIWSWLYAYFVTPTQEQEFSNCFEKGLSIVNQEIASHYETNTVYNREYPWSPSCCDTEEYAWVDTRIKTGEIETITEKKQIPDYSNIESLLEKYGVRLDEEDNIGVDDFKTSQYKEVTTEREIEKEIGKILHATTDLIWEEEYDATKENTISLSFPCANLIEVMELKQLVADGFFYDSDGKLAAFDTDLTQNINSVVVRKDILDEFLLKTGMRLIWIVQAEKNFYSGEYLKTKRSKWEALFTYNGDNVSGEFHRL